MTSATFRTRKQILKALASIDAEVKAVSPREVEITVYEGEEYIHPTYGIKTRDVDFEATERAADLAGDILGWGGFRQGCGTWTFRKDYTVDEHDYCSPFSRDHY